MERRVARALSFLAALAAARLLWDDFGLPPGPGVHDDDDRAATDASRRRLRNQDAIAGREKRRKFLARIKANQERKRQSRETMVAGVSLTDFADPKSVEERAAATATARGDLFDRAAREVEAAQLPLMAATDEAIAEGRTAFVVRPQAGDETSLFDPPEVLIEILNPLETHKYSVTVVSHDRYTGTALRVQGNQWTTEPSTYSWRPVFPGHYEIIVHEMDGEYSHTTPILLQPFPILVREGVPGAGVAALDERIRTMPPCQTQDRKDIYTRWEGDWLGPEFNLEESLRSGWSFLPKGNMNCKLETFDRDAIKSIPEKRSIFILGRSVERGIFLSLVDMMLEKKEKKLWKTSVIGKCWGRASVSKGNLEVTYQDFRVNSFEDPTKPRFIECHNEKLVKQPGSSFIQNATLVWEEIFKKDEADWPDVLFLVVGLGTMKFKFTHHVHAFVRQLPPNWKGTLFLGDFAFSARGGFMNAIEYEAYLTKIAGLLAKLEDPRVRWIDGEGVSKEMRMYTQKGTNYLARSQHFHSPCLVKDKDNSRIAMTVCSNITEVVGQLLLGHALGPKAEFVERVERNENPPPDETLRWCEACPECMIPFHIAPYPTMRCHEGALITKVVDNKKCMSKRNDKGGGDEGGDDPSSCPDSCLQSEATDSFATESDTVYVRQCPVE